MDCWQYGMLLARFQRVIYGLNRVAKSRHILILFFVSGQGDNKKRKKMPPSKRKAEEEQLRREAARLDASLRAATERWRGEIERAAERLRKTGDSAGIEPDGMR
jgi:hypothetical protein